MTTFSGVALCQVLDRLGPSIFAGVLDTEGVLHHANQSALEAIDVTADQVLGRGFVDTPWWQACALSREKLRQALANGLRGEASRFDVRVASVKGATLHMDFSLTPLCDAKGEINWLIPSARDVSERRNAERELRFTRSAVEYAGEAILQVAPNGKLLQANPAASRLLGLGRDQLLQQRMTDFASYSDAKSWSQRWGELCHLGELGFETSVRHYLGYDIPVEVTARLIAIDGGSIAQLCIGDLRGREGAKFRLRQCKDELRQLVDVLHDQIARREQAEKALSDHLEICRLSPR